MWEAIWAAVLNSLSNMAVGLCLFLVAYIANMAFSIFLNVKVLDQAFDSKKILDSLIKVGTFGVGSALLTIAITSIPMFCSAVGLTIPEEYIDVFSKLAILAVTLTAACKYVSEAFGKMKTILSSSSNNTKEIETVIQNNTIAQTIEKSAVASEAIAAAVEKVVTPVVESVSGVNIGAVVEEKKIEQTVESIPENS